MVHNEEQREIVDQIIKELELLSGRKIHVDIEYAMEFYKAEEYHQKWKKKNR